MEDFAKRRSLSIARLAEPCDYAIKDASRRVHVIHVISFSVVVCNRRQPNRSWFAMQEKNACYGLRSEGDVALGKTGGAEVTVAEEKARSRRRVRMSEA